MKFKFEEIVYEGKNGTRKPTKDDQLFYVGLEHLESDTLSINRFGSKTPLKTTMKVMKQGDILFGRRNAYLRRTGIAPHDGICSGDIMILYPIDKVIDKDFLPFFLSSDYFFDIAIDSSTGSIMKRAMWSKLKNIEFTLPTISDQKHLAELLWAMEDTKQAYKKLLKATDALVNAKFIEKFGDPETNPMGWEVKRVDEISNTQLGKMLDGKKQTGKNSYHYLANFNVQWFKVDVSILRKMDFNENEREKYSLQAGDLLVCEGGEVGRTAIWNNEISNCFIQNAVHRVRCDINKCIPFFLAWMMFYYANNSIFEKITSQVTIAHLTNEKLNALTIPIPPLPLQTQFYDFVCQVEQYKEKIILSLKSLELSMREVLNGCFNEK